MSNLSKFILRAAFLLCFFAQGHAVYAKTLTAVCHDISGDTVFYSTKNTIKQPNNTFIKKPDGITGASITLVWEMEKAEAKFILADPDPDFGSINTKDLKLIYVTKKQISFSGLQGTKTPILFSLYPAQEMGVYSAHSTFEPYVEGLVAHSFTMKCKFKVK